MAKAKKRERYMVIAVSHGYLQHALSKLADEVNRAVVDGYEPVGGVNVIFTNPNFAEPYYATQAVFIPTPDMG